MEATAVLGVLFVIGLFVVLPIVGVVAVVMIASRRSRLRHEERMAMIARGLAPPEDRSWAAERPVVRRDPLRPIAWAVGLLVAGLLWAFTNHHFAAILIGAGSALLVRGLLAMRGGQGDQPGGVQ